MIIGITGGIGSGKTTFSNLLRSESYLVYDTDLEAKRIQNEDDLVREKIIQLFGEKAYKNNELNRKYVAGIVFSDKEKLQQLNQIVHPVVKTNMLQWIQLHQNEKILFVECAILFEGGFNHLVDKVLVVTASKETRIQRVMNRDNVTKAQVLDRMKHQLSETERLEMSDYVIRTDKPESLSAQLQKFLIEIGI